MATEETKRSDGIWQSVLENKNKKSVKRNILKTLGGVHIFSELGHRDLHNIAQISYHRSYNEGEAIISEAQPAAGMYVIIDGAVKVTSELEDGTIINLATLESGTFFGDVGLLDSSARTATVTAIRSSKVLGFFRPELLKLIEANPKLASKVLFKLAQVMAKRLRFTNEELHKSQAEIDQLMMERDAK